MKKIIFLMVIMFCCILCIGCTGNVREILTPSFELSKKEAQEAIEKLKEKYKDEEEEFDAKEAIEELKEKYRTKLIEPIDILADIKVIEVRIEDLEERVDFSGPNWGNIYRIICNPDEVGDDGGGPGPYSGGAGPSISKNAPIEDIEAVPTDIQIGETWIGPSGQEYIATTPNPATVAVAVAVGVTVTASLKPVDIEKN